MPFEVIAFSGVFGVKTSETCELLLWSNTTAEVNNLTHTGRSRVVQHALNFFFLINFLTQIQTKTV